MFVRREEGRREVEVGEFIEGCLLGLVCGYWRLFIFCVVVEECTLCSLIEYRRLRN